MNAFIWSRYWRAEASVPARALVESRGVQLAAGDGLQPRARMQRDDVLCAEFDRSAPRSASVNAVAHQDHRNVGGAALPRFQGGRRLVCVRDAQENELRPGLCQCVAEAGDVTDPGAVHGMPRIAQSAVDDLHGVLLPGQDDQRDRAGFDQGHSPRDGRPPGDAAICMDRARTITNGSPALT